MKDLLQWWPLFAAILAAGIWLGTLNARVTALEQEQRFFHGDPPVSEGAR